MKDKLKSLHSTVDWTNKKCDRHQQRSEEGSQSKEKQELDKMEASSNLSPYQSTDSSWSDESLEEILKKYQSEAEAPTEHDDDDFHQGSLHFI